MLFVISIYTSISHMYIIMADILPYLDIYKCMVTLIYHWRNQVKLLMLFFGSSPSLLA